MLQSTERILRDEETDEDLRLIFAPGSSLGGARSPAYDLNPVPADLKARELTTNIDLDESTCSIDLLESAANYFALSLAKAREIIKEVAVSTFTWRAVAKEAGAAPAEIHRMASAFDHDALKQALSMP